jgi:LysM repeat protein
MSHKLSSKRLITLGLLVILGLGGAATANAGIASLVTNFFATPKKTDHTVNSQNIALLTAARNLNPNPAQGGGDTTIVAESALLPESGPMGTVADIKDTPSSDQISIYTVRAGDNLSQIADMFNVTINTIRWANDLSKGSAIKEGDVLVILPISGLKHVVKPGDTVASIAKKYNASASEIASYNDLEVSGKLAVGETVIVPDGEITTATTAKPKSKIKGIAGKVINDVVGFLSRPVKGGTKTQGIHGYNGVDIGAAVGTPIYASAAGRVIIARDGGWNGGYGSYIVISHPNGVQTLYAHLSEVSVSVGQSVGQGDYIGAMGSTGRSTGSHLHFEVRGAKNPF